MGTGPAHRAIDRPYLPRGRDMIRRNSKFLILGVAVASIAYMATGYIGLFDGFFVVVGSFIGAGIYDNYINTDW